MAINQPVQISINEPERQHLVGWAHEIHAWARAALDDPFDEFLLGHEALIELSSSQSSQLNSPGNEAYSFFEIFWP
jgi:hypothetical protein